MIARCRLTDDWLPLPDSVLAATGWSEGDQVDIEVIDPGTPDATLIVTRQAGGGSESQDCLKIRKMIRRFSARL